MDRMQQAIPNNAHVPARVLCALFQDSFWKDQLPSKLWLTLKASGTAISENRSVFWTEKPSPKPSIRWLHSCYCIFEAVVFQSFSVSVACNELASGDLKVSFVVTFHVLTSQCQQMGGDCMGEIFPIQLYTPYKFLWILVHGNFTDRNFQPFLGSNWVCVTWKRFIAYGTLCKLRCFLVSTTKMPLTCRWASAVVTVAQPRLRSVTRYANATRKYTA